MRRGPVAGEAHCAHMAGSPRGQRLRCSRYALPLFLGTLCEMVLGHHQGLVQDDGCNFASFLRGGGMANPFSLGGRR